ncbi:MAG: cation-translocating P-type ATPase [Dongiaceae bacterium]
MPAVDTQSDGSRALTPEQRTAPTWHTMPIDAVAAQLATSPAVGLDAAEAARRRRQFGINAIVDRHRRGPLSLLAAQFLDFTILVLVGAAVISGLIGDLKDTLVIGGIIILNATIAFAQEIRAQRAVLALRRLGATRATVVRGGQRETIAAEGLVPGDLVVLEAGNAVPADLRLTEAIQLRTNESALTGESHSVDKRIAVFETADLLLGDRANMAFRGTHIAAGRGSGIVVATGMQTEIGGLASLIEGAGDVQTPLQQRLGQFGRWLGIVVIGICAVVFAVGIARGEPAALMFLTAISLAVAAIPEALPATLTISLSLGARRMVSRKALVRRLVAVEALGSVTYICSDKTGTLTQDRMHVEEICDPAGRKWNSRDTSSAAPWSDLLTALALNNDVEVRPDGETVGDATEVALYMAATAAGRDKAALSEQMPRVLELPFESERKCMTTFHPAPPGGYVAWTKGAPEAVIARARCALGPDGEVPLDTARALAEAHRMAEAGMRVLAVGRRHWSSLPTDDLTEVEKDLTLLGLVGVIDPPRTEAATAVAACKDAGIRVTMITGDHPGTARAIAERLGILMSWGQVMTGAELAKTNDDELAERIEQIQVFARMDPAQKIRIIQALQARGEFVAMTGDGVNDAPALKRANVGVAMGRSGTDVAREAAGLVLLDDNFATIVAAVHEGRRIFDNIRKFIRYMLTGNSAEIWTIFLAPFLGLPIPLLPIHILWVNLVTDSLPALALTAEHAEPDVMRRRPRPPEESIVAGGLWQHAVWVGLLIAGCSLLAEVYAVQTGMENWQTMVFTVLTCSQLGHVLAIRSDRVSALRDFFGNPWLLGAVVLTLALQAAIIYVPALNLVFSTVPLSARELLVCVVLSVTPFIAVEIEKTIRRRRRASAPSR